MPLRVGIDEAGYGPRLGPLVVAASVWDVPEPLVQADLWSLLDSAVCRAGRQRRGEWRLAVDDSKRVYDRQRGLHTLERSVLAFARAAGVNCRSVAALLRSVLLEPPRPDDAPWYAALDGELPVSGSAAACDGVATRLLEAMRQADVRCAALSAEIVTEPHFNRRVAQTRSKAAIVIEQVLRLVRRCAQRAGDRDVFIHVDRLGGRTRYRDLLRDAFPERHLHVLQADDAVQRYRLAGARSDWFLCFEVDADRHHLPVALASMLAKYLREVVMLRFNAYWRRWLPTLRPTAGYATDAQRFLHDIAAILPKTGLPAQTFVRAR